MTPNTNFPYPNNDEEYVPTGMTLEEAQQMDLTPGDYITNYTGDTYEAQSVVGPVDPPPILSNNPVQPNIVMFKELSGYPNYGNPSRNADILYTGNRGTWTFQSPFMAMIPGSLRAQMVIRAVLDDHPNVPENRYSLRITINGTVVHNGRVQLPHGRPAGAMFDNWVNLTFNVPNMRRVPQVIIENTSTTSPNDWIAFDWMQMRFLPR